VVKDADIYIFDDTFSALDAKTESVVLGRVQKLLKGKTVLMVAQKISTIRHADQIIVLDKGRIVGKGTHEELLQSCREYQDIYETQNYLEGEGKENAK
jgi:ATP-binding cassette subfamily B protein